MAVSVTDRRWLWGASAVSTLAALGVVAIARSGEPVHAAVSSVAAIAAPVPPSADAAYRRPLFAPPAIGAGELPADAPSLSGIVGRIGGDAVALVRDGGGETRTIAPGEAVDGWTLQSLALDAAFFTRGGQRVRVPLPAGDDAPPDQ